MIARGSPSTTALSALENGLTSGMSRGRPELSLVLSDPSQKALFIMFSLRPEGRVDESLYLFVNLFFFG
ncbi:hypothetical protein YC2023_087639 [Brassica napus]